jgi:hypothetical protein
MHASDKHDWCIVVVQWTLAIACSDPMSVTPHIQQLHIDPLQ